MTVGRGGWLSWELSSNRCEVYHLSGKYPRLDLDELRDVPGLHWNLERRLVQQCIDAMTPTVPLRDWD